MTGLMAKNAGLHWRAFKDEETYYDFRDGKLHNKWAPARLVAVGEIDAGEYDAATRYDRLVQRAKGYGTADVWSRVDGSRHDPHARALDRVVCGLQADSAFMFVVGRHDMPVKVRTRKRTMGQLFSYPHPTFQDIRGDESHKTTIRRVRACLSLLRVYFDMCDADREKWNGSVDKIPEYAETERHLDRGAP